MKNMKLRVPMYFIGLFIMTIGSRKQIQKRTGLSANPVRYFFVLYLLIFYFFYKLKQSCRLRISS